LRPGKGPEGSDARQLADVQPGDRILVRGKLADDGKSVVAASVIAMKKVDIRKTVPRARRNGEHGFGGLVNGAMPLTAQSALPCLPRTKKRTWRSSFKETILRRYASDSVKFDDAKPRRSTRSSRVISFRARGTRSADGAEFTADEIVSGTFRNIAGTISALRCVAAPSRPGFGSKKLITVRITAESQLRKLPAQMAQRIAMRLKGTPTEAQPNAPTPNVLAPLRMRKQRRTSGSQPGARRLAGLAEWEARKRGRCRPATDD